MDKVVDKKQARRQLLSKIGMVIFLVLLALGFMVPGFINSPDSPTGGVVATNEPRLCRTDADCSLLCDSQPVQVLCLQNMCVKNSCQEGNPYPYNEFPVTFTLSVTVEATKIPLADRVLPENEFVQISRDGDIVTVFTSGLSLQSIIEKARLQLTESCLMMEAVSYCTTAEKNLSITVNGQKKEYLDQYLPQSGDIVEITYA